MRLLCCCMFSVLYYGVETWTLTVIQKKIRSRPDVTLSKNAGDILQILQGSVSVDPSEDAKEQWNPDDRKNNKALLDEEWKQVYHLLQSIINGKRGIGRRRFSWLGNPRNWTFESTAELFKETQHRNYSQDGCRHPKRSAGFKIFEALGQVFWGFFIDSKWGSSLICFSLRL